MTDKEYFEYIRKREGNVEIKKSEVNENVYYVGKLDTYRMVKTALSLIR